MKVNEVIYGRIHLIILILIFSFTQQSKLKLALRNHLLIEETNIVSVFKHSFLKYIGYQSKASNQDNINFIEKPIKIKNKPNSTKAESKVKEKETGKVSSNFSKFFNLYLYLYLIYKYFQASITLT